LSGATTPQHELSASARLAIRIDAIALKSLGLRLSFVPLAHRIVGALAAIAKILLLPILAAQAGLFVTACSSHVPSIAWRRAKQIISVITQVIAPAFRLIQHSPITGRVSLGRRWQRDRSRSRPETVECVNV
jgi:hypothetical protein